MRVIVPQTPENLSRLREIMARGGLIAFRTDTFYGLGADPFNADSVKKIKHLKGREGDKPILVVISDIAQINRLIEKRSQAFSGLTEKFWPGALTIIGAAVADLPEDLTAGTKTVGVRLPDNDKVRALIKASGGALTATSANPSGQPPARTATEVESYFGERVDLIIDGGDVDADAPSTVVDATTERVNLIREGAIPWAEIQSVL